MRSTRASASSTRHSRSPTNTRPDAAARGMSDVDLVVLAYVAGQDVPLEEDERNAALRRALFVFAAGGALNRDPAMDDPAVIELAGDIDSAERRAALAAAVERLDGDQEALERLRDPETAWRAYACALLADALGEDEDEA